MSENEVHVEPFSLDKIDEVATKLQIEGKYVEALYDFAHQTTPLRR